MRFLTGIVRAFSWLHLEYRTRARSVSSFIPVSEAHSLTVFFTPLKNKKWFDLRFMACSRDVAHRQFIGEYPLSLFILSRDILSGLGPISFWNATKDLRHLLQTRIPRLPCELQRLSFGFSQRAIMCFQARYTAVPVIPCVPFAAARFASRFRQPQDRVVPSRNRKRCLVDCFPQSQIHKQSTPRPSLFSTSNTTKRPNLSPFIWTTKHPSPLMATGLREAS